MYAESIPHPALPPDTTTIGRELYAELRRRWEDGGRRPFLASHRPLADLIGCSPSAMPRHMRALEDAQVITRAAYKNTYRIVLTDGPSVWDAPTDRSGPNTDRSADDPRADASHRADAADHDPAPQRQIAQNADVIDPILPNGTHESMQQQQDARAWDGMTGDHQALCAELALDDAGVVADLFRHHPALTLTQFAGEVVLAGTRPNVYCPRAVALKALSRGERITPARTVAPPAAAPAQSRERPRRAGPDRPPAPDAWGAIKAAYEAEQAARDAAFVQRQAAPPPEPDPAALMRARDLAPPGVPDAALYDLANWLADEKIPPLIALDRWRREQVRYAA